MNRRTEATAGQIVELDPRRVKPFADQPRKRFRGIKQLAESIRTIGQITPIIVTDCSEPGYDAELVDGERRLRACLVGKISIVLAVIERDGAAADRYARSVAANFCRQGHDPVEVLEAILALREAGKSNDQIAAILGKNVGWVNQYLGLRRLSSHVLECLKVPDDADRPKGRSKRQSKLPLSVALLVASLEPRLQLKALNVILAGEMSMAEARTYVWKLAAAKGHKVGAKQSDYSRFKSVRTAVETCYQVIERYLRMPGVEIKHLVATSTKKEREQLAERLDSLCTSLLMLHDELVKQ